MPYLNETFFQRLNYTHTAMSIICFIKHSDIIHETACHGDTFVRTKKGKTLMKSTPRAVPQKRCSSPIFIWLGKFEEHLN